MYETATQDSETLPLPLPWISVSVPDTPKEQKLRGSSNHSYLAMLLQNLSVNLGCFLLGHFKL